MEAETAVIAAQGKEHQGRATATKKEKKQELDSPLECSEGEQPCGQLGFRFLVSKTEKDKLFQDISIW